MKSYSKIAVMLSIHCTTPDCRPHVWVFPKIKEVSQPEYAKSISTLMNASI